MELRLKHERKCLNVMVVHLERFSFQASITWLAHIFLSVHRIDDRPTDPTAPTTAPTTSFYFFTVGPTRRQRQERRKRERERERWMMKLGGGGGERGLRVDRDKCVASKNSTKARFTNAIDYMCNTTTTLLAIVVFIHLTLDPNVVAVAKMSESCCVVYPKYITNCHSSSQSL